MQVTITIISTIATLLTYLASCWVGVTVILLLTSLRPVKAHFFLLLLDLLMAILSLGLAFMFREVIA